MALISFWTIIDRMINMKYQYDKRLELLMTLIINGIYYGYCYSVTVNAFTPLISKLTSTNEKGST